MRKRTIYLGASPLATKGILNLANMSGDTVYIQTLLNGRNNVITIKGKRDE